MKFLIIGASGFVGTHLFSLLSDSTHTAIGTQSSNKHAKLIKYDILKDNILDCVAKDFFQDERVCVVICASLKQIDSCFNNKELSYRINVEKTIELMNILKSLGAKIVFLSTSFVFDGFKGYHTENDMRQSVCEYGKQKLEVEKYMENNIPDALVVRLDKIVGDNPAEEHLFTEWQKLVAQKKPIVCIKGQIISPTDVDDIAKAIILGCENDMSGVYHTANTEFFERSELAKQFLNITGLDGAVISRPMDEFNFTDARPLKTYLDSSKFINATGMHFKSIRVVMNSFKEKLDSKNNGFV